MMSWRTVKLLPRSLLLHLKPCQQLAVVLLGVVVVIWTLTKLEGRTPPDQSSVEVPKDIIPQSESTKRLLTNLQSKSFNPYETQIETVYKQGFMGYNTSRIPALVYHGGYFLAFCEARKQSYFDIGQMDLVVRRGKRTRWQVDWEPVIIVSRKNGYRLMNPTPIVDAEVGAIVLVFIVMPQHLDQWTMVQQGRIQQQIMVTRSFDVGLTWTEPVDITASTIGTMVPPPGIYATGPGHGIQMSSGRLIVPGNYFVKDKNGAMLKGMDHFYGTLNHGNVIYSDDDGITWRLGGHIPFSKDTVSGRTIHSNEAVVVEVQEGVLLLNTRTLHPDLPRVQAVSSDGGHSFSMPKLVPELVEPGYYPVNNKPVPSKAAGCHASIIGFPAPSTAKSHSPWLVFSNPASRHYREHMSLRISNDGGNTWSPPWTIYQQPAAYSDLTYFETTDPDTGLAIQNFAILFEGGSDRFPYRKIMFKMFNLDAMLAGVQRTYVQ